MRSVYANTMAVLQFLAGLFIMAHFDTLVRRKRIPDALNVPDHRKILTHSWNGTSHKLGSRHAEAIHASLGSTNATRVDLSHTGTARLSSKTKRYVNGLGALMNQQSINGSGRRNRMVNSGRSSAGLRTDVGIDGARDGDTTKAASRDRGSEEAVKGKELDGNMQDSSKGKIRIAANRERNFEMMGGKGRSARDMQDARRGRKQIAVERLRNTVGDFGESRPVMYHLVLLYSKVPARAMCTIESLAMFLTGSKSILTLWVESQQMVKHVWQDFDSILGHVKDQVLVRHLKFVELFEGTPLSQFYDAESMDSGKPLNTKQYGFYAKACLSDAVSSPRFTCKVVALTTHFHSHRDILHIPSCGTFSYSLPSFQAENCAHACVRYAM